MSSHSYSHARPKAANDSYGVAAGPFGLQSGGERGLQLRQHMPLLQRAAVDSSPVNSVPPVCV